MNNNEVNATKVIQKLQGRLTEAYTTIAILEARLEDYMENENERQSDSVEE